MISYKNNFFFFRMNFNYFNLLKPQVWSFYPVPVLIVGMARGVALQRVTQSAFVPWKLIVR